MKRDPSNSTFSMPPQARALAATVNHLTVSTPGCLSTWQCESGDSKSLIVKALLDGFAVAYGHTTLNTPDLVRSRKLSRVGPG